MFDQLMSFITLLVTFSGSFTVAMHMLPAYTCRLSIIHDVQFLKIIQYLQHMACVVLRT